MRYRNPTLPEGINTTRVHPLREFALLSLGALALIGVLAVTLGYFGGRLSPWLVSVETEMQWSQHLGDKLDTSQTSPPLRRYFDELGERVSTVMALPEGMRVRLVYNDEETVNAFATLGGTILLSRGLLQKIPHENALVMLIAHEIAHVEHRDPIVSIGSAIGIQTALSLLISGTDAAPLQDIGLFTQFAFSRDMERDADIAALQAVADIYGHVGGADDLFRIIQNERREKGDAEPPAFLSTHPLDERRIKAIELATEERGWRRDLPTTPLPAQFRQWLETEGE
ncbi:MAG: M48 family metallopeptidase [Candidatus Thiodiazotropha sp.]